MSKLLSANFNRLKKDKIFWITLIAALTLSVFAAINSGASATKYQDLNPDNNITYLNSCYFNLMPIVGIFYAVFISLFLGTEYSEGTIRNKIVLGHTRTNIYLANFITCLAGNIVIYCAMLIGGLAAVPYLGGWQGGAASLLANILIGLFLTAALTAILTMLCMLSTNKAITAVAAILLAFVLMVGASAFYNMLQEPEFTREFISISADGQVEFGDEILNPAYVSGFRRKLYEFLLVFLPTGQGILMANQEIHFPVELIYSSIITVAVNICGVLAFKKKDLK
ncbi:MAG: ABC transporter permease [Eubacterium sp.]|nr:ABC transporter permease [Eubacterium sp.]